MDKLNLSQMDKDEVVRRIVELGGEGIQRCVQCGACASTCPVALAGFDNYCKILIKRLLSGQVEEYLDDASTWACVACNRCTEICPRDVKPADIVFAFRRIQASEMAISTSSLTPIMNLHSKGHAVYNEQSRQLREKVGLPPVPPTSAGDQQAQKEIQTLLENSPMADLGAF